MTERRTENKQKLDGILPLGSSRLHFVGKIGGGGGYFVHGYGALRVT
jgi:hypothetical protein